ncbi:MAG: hypothetical protein ABL926_10205 [Novosphingobium sp.]
MTSLARPSGCGKAASVTSDGIVGPMAAAPLAGLGRGCATGE